MEREGAGKVEGGKLRERGRQGEGERGQASICASVSALGLRVLSCVRSLVSHAPYAHTSSPASSPSCP